MFYQNAFLHSKEILYLVLLQKTLNTALKAEMWLQVGYAYLVSAEIQIRTGQYLKATMKCISSPNKNFGI